MKYISVDALQAFCDNSKDHSITPNDFQRMNHIEIVRCKDCKRWTSPSFGYKNAQVGDCRILGATHADWFCADGERKDGDGNG